MATDLAQLPEQILPSGTIPLDNQVAGHTFQPGTNAVGLLKNEEDGSVLKPLGKPTCGVREVGFYESLHNTNNVDLIALRRLVPEYRGKFRMSVNNMELDFIKLNDLTHGMSEPCIIDLKVGKRTWDPLATPEKIAAEEEKYAACKENLGLCIPGLQVYSIKTGKLKRFGKDYGKQLNERTFRNTLKTFLNADNGICQTLVFQILSQLYEIQKWSHTQTSIKLFSSSILIVYDAKRLKTYLRDSTKIDCNNLNGSMFHSIDKSPSDVNNKPNMKINNSTAEKNIHTTMQNSHTFKQDNFDKDFRVTQNYWAHVKLIDFAHVFPSDDKSLDSNYSFGIDSLVKIFEDFLEESNYQENIQDMFKPCSVR